MSAMHVCDACQQCMFAVHVCNACLQCGETIPRWNDGLQMVLVACKLFFELDSVNRIRSLLWKIWMVLKEQI